MGYQISGCKSSKLKQKNRGSDKRLKGRYLDPTMGEGLSSRVGSKMRSDAYRSLTGDWLLIIDFDREA